MASITNDIKTLLLVEDEPIIAMSEAAVLKRHGYEVITAYSGEAAVVTVSSGTRIDLVLMDIDLGGGMDGTEAARIILESVAVPVVFLSSHTEKATVEKTEGITSYGYIVKNSGETVLIASIKMAFRLHDALRKIENQKQEIEATNEELQATIEEMEAANEELIRSQNEIIERDRALQISEERFSKMFMENPLSMALTRLSDGIIIDINRSYERLFELTREERIGLAYHVLNATTDPSDCDKMAVDFNKNGILREFETRFKSKSGKFVNTLISADILDINGEKCALSVMIDITDKKLTERALMESEQRNKLVASLITDYIFKMLVDENGSVTIVDASDNFKDITGRSVADLGGMENWIRTIHPDDMQIVKDHLKALVTTGGPVDFECRTFVKDGRPRWVQIFAKGESETPGGRITRIVGAVRDITARKKAEDELRDMVAQKETLMKELQHRVRNNLAMISSLFALEIDRASSDETRTVIASLRDRVSSLENLYSVLYRSEGTDRLRMDQVIQEIVKTITRTYLPEGSDITIEVDCEPVEINMKSASSLGIVVNELITNAIKHAFSPGGGVITISIQKNDGSYELSVRDNGRGLPGDFDPSRSSGFGLMLADMLAKQLGGKFEIRNEGGSVFTLSFQLS